MPKLSILRGGRVEREVELGIRDLLIGRSSDNDIVLDDPERTVSRHHAEVRLEETRYVIVDVGSQNGIVHGGRRVQRAELRPGDSVSIGSFTLAFEMGKGPAPDLEYEPTVPVRLDTAELELRQPEPVRKGPGVAHLITDTHRSAPQVPDLSPVTPPARRPASSRWPLIVAGGVCAVAVFAALAYVYLRPRPAPPASVPASADAERSRDEVIRQSLAGAETAIGEGRLEDAGRLVEKAETSGATGSQTAALRARLEAATKTREVQANVVALEAPPVPPTEPPAAQANLTPSTSTDARAGATKGAAALPRESAAPAATGTVPLPASAGYPLLTRRPGESPDALRARSRMMNDRYLAAGEMLRARQFSDAVAALSAIAGEERGYRSVASLLAEARYGLATQSRQILAGAQKLEDSGDLIEALAELDRARQTDPSLPEHAELMRKLKDHIEKDASDAYAKAKAHDAAGRNTEAAEQYDRVVKLLPRSDARHQTALARLKALRTVGR